MIRTRDGQDLSLFPGNGTSWYYGGTTSATKSSLTLYAGSLAVNQTYQFRVVMQNRVNPSIQATGYLLVYVDTSNSPMIIIA